ncbi:hypothetical protein AQ938_07090 [Burkholderia pseudomallei]|uniref:hypothetical protein n=1 Tax=Burkholderia pseudomallei TaxID=28450 RepID=UPI0005102335|nr:hypothetical protein [Burkholderia pseudomallei]MWA22325.1 hypothetical protein [Burkholderia pseudomallei]OND79034.1 hypothetical protein AQ938_07090 [Burkholderia pseudomallei]
MSDDPVPIGGAFVPVDPPRVALRDFYAAHVDVSLYRPMEALLQKLGRPPSMTELAAFIADIRLMEADALMKAREIP